MLHLAPAHMPNGISIGLAVFALQLTADSPIYFTMAAAAETALY